MRATVHPDFLIVGVDHAPQQPAEQHPAGGTTVHDRSKNVITRAQTGCAWAKIPP
jgi:hypothetical protein